MYVHTPLAQCRRLLHECNIGDIPQLALANLPSLRHINFADNNITMIRDHLFGNNTNVRDFNMLNNPVWIAQQRPFLHMQDLQVVRTDGMELVWLGSLAGKTATQCNSTNKRFVFDGTYACCVDQQQQMCLPTNAPTPTPTAAPTAAPNAAPTTSPTTVPSATPGSGGEETSGTGIVIGVMACTALIVAVVFVWKRRARTAAAKPGGTQTNNHAFDQTAEPGASAADDG